MSDAGWAGRVLAWLGDPPYHERVWNHKHDASAPHHDEAKEEEEADGEIYGGTRAKGYKCHAFSPYIRQIPIFEKRPFLDSSDGSNTVLSNIN